MPEPFKEFFNTTLITDLSAHLTRVWGRFPAADFMAMATAGLADMELKARASHIASALDQCLPASFTQAAKILVKSLHPNPVAPLSELRMNAEGVRGWAVMPMAEYVARKGIAEFDLGLEVLKELTKRFSAEFAIREFILADQTRAFKTLLQFSRDDNFHVRRLASEGARPRLPWGKQLPQLMRNPNPLWPIIEPLMSDPHDYVRRSVANNLNDIAKDNPHLVIERLAKWWPQADNQQKRLLKHACRTLIKNGDLTTLKIMGFDKPKVIVEKMILSADKVDIGDSVDLTVTLKSTSKSVQKILLDYVVFYKKSNGKNTPKVFKWTATELHPGASVKYTKRLSFKTVTTRTLFSGEHSVAVQVNGQNLAQCHFLLCE